jgi:hypothetical protein
MTSRPRLPMPTCAKLKFAARACLLMVEVGPQGAPTAQQEKWGSLLDDPVNRSLALGSAGQGTPVPKAPALSLQCCVRLVPTVLRAQAHARHVRQVCMGLPQDCRRQRVQDRVRLGTRVLQVAPVPRPLCAAWARTVWRGLGRVRRVRRVCMDRRQV